MVTIPFPAVRSRMEAGQEIVSIVSAVRIGLWGELILAQMAVSHFAPEVSDLAANIFAA